MFFSIERNRRPADEQGQNLRSIAVVRHDMLVGIVPTRDMIDGIGEFEMKRTRHGRNGYPSRCNITRPDPL